MLARLPGTDIKMVAEEPGPKRTETKTLTLVADHAIADVRSPDILVVPGGLGNRRLLDHEPLLDWIRGAHETSKWTTSVCTGSLLLGAAGVLEGLSATSHWMSLDRLREFGAEPTLERVVRQGKIVTAAGVSAGIDMALRLVAWEAGDEVAQAIQLAIEYDPEPPFDTGSLEKAPPELVELVRMAMDAEDARTAELLA